MRRSTEQAEFHLIAGVLMRPELIYEVRELLGVNSFTAEAARVAWHLVIEMLDAGCAISRAAVASEVKVRGIAEPGERGMDWLRKHELLSNPGTEMVLRYASEVGDGERMRKLTRDARQWEGMTRDGFFDLDATVTRIQSDLGAIESRSAVSSRSAVGDIEDSLATLGRQSQDLVPTGWPHLDAMVAGFAPGEVVVVAARAGMGKTTFAINLMIRSPSPCCLVSLEMSSRQIGLTMAKILTGRSRYQLEEGGDDLRAEAQRSIREKLTPDRIRTVYLPTLTVDRFKGIAQVMKARHGIRLFVIDNLSIMGDPSTRKQGRVQEISAITRGLKIAAGELGVTIILISQLNRAPAARKDARPILTDLRDSGSIEQDSDVVLMLWRASYQKAVREGDECELILRKGRGRQLGTARFRFDPRTETYYA